MNIDIDNIWGFYGSPQPLDHRPMGFPTLPSKVFHIRWHMGHYGHDSQKPERGWTNNSYFQRLDLGTWKRGDGPKPKAITVKKTISKRTGKPCYTGTPALKATQPRPHLVWFSMSISILCLFQIVHLPPWSTFYPWWLYSKDLPSRLCWPSSRSTTWSGWGEWESGSRWDPMPVPIVSESTFQHLGRSKTGPSAQICEREQIFEYSKRMVRGISISIWGPP